MILDARYVLYPCVLYSYIFALNLLTLSTPISSPHTYSPIYHFPHHYKVLDAHRYKNIILQRQSLQLQP